MHRRNSDGARKIRRAVSDCRTELNAQAFEATLDASIIDPDDSGIYNEFLVRLLSVRASKFHFC